MILYVKNKDIDKRAWDTCVENAENGLIYGSYDYLQHMATGWDGIIIGNYDAVMPVPYRVKFGIPYLYQPAFVQQGGLYGNYTFSEQDFEEIISLLQQKFKLAEIALNYNQSTFSSEEFPYQIRLRNNFICSLQKGYEEISARYSTSTKQRIARGKKEGLQYLPFDNPESIIRLYKEMIAGRTSAVKSSDYKNFTTLCSHLQQKEKLACRAVYSKSEELLAACILLVFRKRLYNIVSYQSENGKKALANYTLYNSIIIEFASQDLTLDFEGSDLKGVAEFYRKFSDTNESYPFLSYNNLPPILKALKVKIKK